jgi:hypothetical protein
MVVRPKHVADKWINSETYCTNIASTETLSPWSHTRNRMQKPKIKNSWVADWLVTCRIPPLQGVERQCVRYFRGQYVNSSRQRPVHQTPLPDAISSHVVSVILPKDFGHTPFVLPLPRRCPLCSEYFINGHLPHQQKWRLLFVQKEPRLQQNGKQNEELAEKLNHLFLFHSQCICRVFVIVIVCLCSSLFHLSSPRLTLSLSLSLWTISARCCNASHTPLPSRPDYTNGSLDKGKKQDVLQCGI